MKYIVSAGGTGGHIYPALAIINKIKEQDKSADILYIGTTNRMESKIIPEKGIPYLGLQLSGLNRHNPFKNIKVLKDLEIAKKESLRKIKEFQPDIVIGVGGYVTYPVIKMAHKLGIKTIIHEQNSIPGLTNKMLSKIVDRVFISLPGSREYFKTKNVIYTGNPRSEEVGKVKKIDKTQYGLNKNKKMVIIVMGSLGSLTMNQKLKDVIPAFKEKDYEVVFVTGKNYYDEYKNMTISNVKIVPFIDNMLEYMKASDLVVSRAGASIISELTVSGVPSILVPSPYVTNNHQYKNALELEKNGASVILKEEEFSKETLLKLIDSLLSDNKRYQSMVQNNLKLGMKDSASKIYQEIINVIKED